MNRIFTALSYMVILAIVAGVIGGGYLLYLAIGANHSGGAGAGLAGGWGRCAVRWRAAERGRCYVHRQGAGSA